MKTVWIIGGYFSKANHYKPHVEMYQKIYWEMSGIPLASDIKVFTYPLLRGLNQQSASYYSHFFGELNLRWPPDIVHCVSGGYFVYLDARLVHPELFKNYHKLIIDSGPIFPTPPQAANFFDQKFNLKSRGLADALTPALEKSVSMMWKISGTSQTNLASTLERNLISLGPKLVILGSRDPYIDHEKFKAVKKSDAVKVVMLDTPNHGRLIREDGYTQAITDFIQV